MGTNRPPSKGKSFPAPAATSAVRRAAPRCAVSWRRALSARSFVPTQGLRANARRRLPILLHVTDLRGSASGQQSRYEILEIFHVRTEQHRLNTGRDRLGRVLPADRGVRLLPMNTSVATVYHSRSSPVVSIRSTSRFAGRCAGERCD